MTIASGSPGLEPRWTSSFKTGVGTGYGHQSRVWFALSHGIVNEVYFPHPDQANTRDLGLIVTDRAGFFSEEKRATHSEVALLAPGVPGYVLTNTCKQARYRIVKTILTDPARDVLLQQVRFEALHGQIPDYSLYAILAPHLANAGYGNNGWVGDYKGVPMFFASRAGTTLALACSTPFLRMSCGYVGVSDGWQQLRAHSRLTDLYDSAPNGNVALTGEIDLARCDGRFVLALSFGRNDAEAGQRARAALLDDFDGITRRYVRGWQALEPEPAGDEPREAEGDDLYAFSIAILKVHASKTSPGGTIASLSIPWGFARGDRDLGGYHLVWPRDLVEIAGGLLAAGQVEGAREVLVYLMSTQEDDGHWPQNMWLNGTPFWRGIQLDETAFPILLADMLRRMDALEHIDVWPTVRRAAGYIVRNGPVTEEDRWEEDPGYSPFTLAVTVSALLAAADFAAAAGEANLARYLTATADSWNDSIERWTYVTDTPVARRAGVEGYYVRLSPPGSAELVTPPTGIEPFETLPRGGGSASPAAHMVSTDPLALVRFGLRDPNDPRIANTIRAIDTTLKTETTSGPVWHRYTGDRYGEYEDGSPFDGAGVGRGWPLLAGERAHYELAAGRREEADRLRQVMAAQAAGGLLIPEQVWDAADIPERELFNGRPSGAATPLAWAHAEYIKLVRSLRDGCVFDLPPQPRERYRTWKVRCDRALWRLNLKIRVMPAGRVLRVETLAPAQVRWSRDRWLNSSDAVTADTGLGIHFADLPVSDEREGSTIEFTFYWPEAGRWEGRNFSVLIGNRR